MVAIVVSAVSVITQRQKKNMHEHGLHLWQGELLLNTMFTSGLQQFLATCGPRPRSYEQLCQELCHLEMASVDTSGTCRPCSTPTWLRGV